LRCNSIASTELDKFIIGFGFFVACYNQFLAGRQAMRQGGFVCIQQLNGSIFREAYIPNSCLRVGVAMSRV
jgi:uncharacterized membrane protein